MSGKRSRTKGHSFEREIAKRFREVGYKGAKRHLEYQGCEANGEDIDGVEPFRVQCKRNKKYCSLTKILEIQDQSGIHLLVTKGDNLPAMVCMKLDDFLKGLQDFGYFRTKE